MKTFGGKEELQQLLQHRDATKDLEIRRELDRLQNETRALEVEQEKVRFELWWDDATTTLEDKFQQDLQHALQEEMQKPGSFLLQSCRIYRGHRYNLPRAAATLSLGYEAVCGRVNLPPGGGIQRCEIIGEARAVATNAAASKQNAEKKAQEQWASYNTRLEVAKAERRVQHQAFLDQARANDDWDLTGKWTIDCDELAQYIIQHRLGKSGKASHGDFQRRLQDQRCGSR